jgi:hypothetical protein
LILEIFGIAGRKKDSKRERGRSEEDKPVLYSCWLVFVSYIFGDNEIVCGCVGGCYVLDMLFFFLVIFNDDLLSRCFFWYRIKVMIS